MTNHIDYDGILTFKILPEHLKLLQRIYLHWDIDFYNAYFNWDGYGWLSQDAKRPYGNSDVDEDIEDITGISDMNEMMKLHRETEVVLSICLRRLKFETGKFIRKDSSSEWQKVDDSEEYGILDGKNLVKIKEII